MADGEKALDEVLHGKIEERELENEMRSSYLDYAMSVIVGRALPDVRDGLKPVHRRVLYAMHDLGLQPNRAYRKCAFIVGEVMGKYHPHGDSAIYETLVRMAQDFALRYPLVDGQGNFGSIDDDPAAAMRYTEARLDSLATEMLRDIDADTVDFGPNYDESTREPVLLPARFPNLLVNGATGIAVGMATNIPPHNLREVIGAVNAYIDDPEIDMKGLMKYVKGPDFPGGGTIMGTQGIRDAYRSGRGSVRVRAKAHIEPMKGGREAIVVTELPFMVKKGGEGGLITKIADLVRDKKITGISDLRDESDRNGMRLVIELKRGGDPAQVVLNQLYKRTGLQQAFGINMVALVDGVPKTLSLRELVEQYVGHQKEVITRRTQHQLARAEARAHILEGLLVALDNLDAVIRLIRRSKDPDTARDGLIERFSLTRAQAQAILDMRLQRLTALEAGKIKEEHKELTKLIKELRAILADEKKVLGLVKSELSEVGDRYGDERRTQITAAEGDLDIEDVIADEQMVVSITASGYAKRTPLTTYRQQRRGGRGVMGMNMKEGDYIEHLHVCSTHDYLLFFTNQGKVYRLKVYELPEGTRASRGRALVNVLPLKEQGAGHDRHPDARLLRGQVPRLRDQAGDGQEDPLQGLRHADPSRRDHRDQRPQGRRARPRPDDLGQGRHHHGLEVGPRHPLQREAGEADGARHGGGKGNERLRQGQRGPLPRRGRQQGLEGGAAGGHRERLRQADVTHRVPGQGPRRQGRADREADREEGRPRRRPCRPRGPGADLHLPDRHGAAQRCRRHLADGPSDPGRPSHEPEEGRPGQCRRAGGRVDRPERQRRVGVRDHCRGGGADGGHPRRRGRGRGGRRQRRGEGDQGEGGRVRLGQDGCGAKPKAKPAPKKSELVRWRCRGEAKVGDGPRIKPKHTATAKQRAEAEAKRTAQALDGFAIRPRRRAAAPRFTKRVALARALTLRASPSAPKWSGLVAARPPAGTAPRPTVSAALRS